VIADPDIRPTSEGFLNSDFKGMPKKVGFPLEAGFLNRIIQEVAIVLVEYTVSSGSILVCLLDYSKLGGRPAPPVIC
jgi:hypothetical protein